MADDPLQPQYPDAPALPDATAVPLPPDPHPQPDAEIAPEEDLEPEPKRPRPAPRKSRASAALPWVLAVVVVVLLAASGGLISAWVVAAMRAVPAPALADTTPSPSPVESSAATAEPSALPSDQPRRTPTPSPVVTQEPAPFVHVVQRNETLQYIADLYGVSVEDIVALNDIRNPNLIRRGRELLIPGYGHQPSPSPGRG